MFHAYVFLHFTTKVNTVYALQKKPCIQVMRHRLNLYGITYFPFVLISEGCPFPSLRPIYVRAGKAEKRGASFPLLLAANWLRTVTHNFTRMPPLGRVSRLAANWYWMLTHNSTWTAPGRRVSRLAANWLRAVTYYSIRTLEATPCTG